MPIPLIVSRLFQALLRFVPEAVLLAEGTGRQFFRESRPNPAQPTRCTHRQVCFRETKSIVGAADTQEQGKLSLAVIGDEDWGVGTDGRTAEIEAVCGR
jgi:hypothetical protein